MSGHGKYYASNNPEMYSVGPCNTKEEAIKEFAAENDGQVPQHIGLGRDIFCSIDGLGVIEDITNGSLYDELYEDAFDGWCDFKRNDKRIEELGNRLTEVFHKWLDEVGQNKSWTIIEEIHDEH